MATAGNFKLKTENYKEQRRLHWPATGRHILAQFDEECIVVYQAFCPDIADYAVQNGKFGGPRYSFTRMTWIKTNFLWMMYRSNWAQKKNQSRILAISLSREGFDQILKFSKGNQSGIHVEGRTPGNVRIQWDPDHDPKGVNQRRRAVQLGIKGIPLQRFHEQYIQHIEDITDFVKEQRQHVLKNDLDKLLTPLERVYRPSDEAICRHILLDDFDSRKKSAKDKTNKDKDNDDEAGYASGEVNGASCEENVTKPIHQGGKVDLIVCLGGAFNPVHTGHVQLVETAIRWLQMNTNYNVVAARLAVAPDSYVVKKSKRKGEVCMKAEHRIKLCELACKGQKLIKTHYSTTNSAYNCGENVRKWENWRNAKVAVVIGADKAVFNNGTYRWHSKSKSNYITVCVGRKGKTDAVRKAYFEDYKEDLTSEPNFYMIEDDIEDVNSTEIRQQLQDTETDLENSSNSEKDICCSETLTITKGHDQIIKGTEDTSSTQNQIVPFSWDELIDEGDLQTKNDEYNNDVAETEERKDTEEICDYILSNKGEKYMPFIQNELNLAAKSGSCHDELPLNLESEDNGARPKMVTNATKAFFEETKPNSNENTNQNTNAGRQTRKDVINNLVSKGWLIEPVGEYILEKFSDLYV